MQPTQFVQHVRQFVREFFRRYGESSKELPAERLLIRDGHYCGRRFNGDQHFAVWFIEEKELKFYGPDGAILDTFNLDRVAFGSLEDAA